MIISNNRLIKVTPPWQQKYVWPESQYGDNLDYFLDISDALADNYSVITSVSACIAPSGDGELVADNLTYQNGIIGVWLSNAISGRLYTVNFKAYSSAGLQFSFFVQLPVSPSINPSGPPFSPYYGPTIST